MAATVLSTPLQHALQRAGHALGASTSKSTTPPAGHLFRQRRQRCALHWQHRQRRHYPGPDRPYQRISWLSRRTTLTLTTSTSTTSIRDDAAARPPSALNSSRPSPTATATLQTGTARTATNRQSTPWSTSSQQRRHRLRLYFDAADAPATTTPDRNPSHRHLATSSMPCCPTRRGRKTGIDDIQVNARHALRLHRSRSAPRSTCTTSTDFMLFQRFTTDPTPPRAWTLPAVNAMCKCGIKSAGSIRLRDRAQVAGAPYDSTPGAQ